MIDELSEDKNRLSDDNTEDLPLSKRIKFVKSGSDAGTVASQLIKERSDSIDHLQEPLNMHHLNNKPHGSKISRREDVQSSSHIHREQAAESLVYL